MKCTIAGNTVYENGMWIKVNICQNEAIEKWTHLPTYDPYCGNYGPDQPPPEIDYKCEFHSKQTKDVWLKVCKYADLVTMERLFAQAFEIEKL
jgi:hypothetical protein